MPNRFALPILAATLVFAANARAQDAADLDFPLTKPAPSWVQADVTAGGIDLEVTPPNVFQHLVATVIFDESAGSTLGISWQTADGKVTLTSNAYEGVAQANQNIVILHQAILGAGGRLSLTGDVGALSGVRRVRLCWVDTLTIYGSDGEKTPVFIQPGGRVITGADLVGAPKSDSGDSVSGEVVNASLSDAVTPLDQGVGFVAPVVGTPYLVRFHADVIGVPLDQGITISVNGGVPQVLNLEVPALEDPGYIAADSGNSYAGWRKAGAVLPVSAFRTGENTVVIAGASGTPLDGAFLRKAGLQLVFAPEPMEPSRVIATPSLEESDEPPRFRMSVGAIEP